jgi:hypothetical protein
MYWDTCCVEWCNFLRYGILRDNSSSLLVSMVHFLVYEYVSLQLLGICAAFLALECVVDRVVESPGFDDTARPIFWFAFPKKIRCYIHLSFMLFYFRTGVP